MIEMRLRDYTNADPDERARMREKLFEADDADVHAMLDRINARLQEYEAAYGLSSDQLRDAITNGELEESGDICAWLMLLTRRNRIVHLQEQG